MGNQKQDKVECVVNAILAHIIDHKLRAGDKLPSEKEFTELFSVSRLCVREALRGLKFLGVVQTGTRRGTTIKEIDFSLLGRILGFQIAISDFSYYELLETRLAIELGAIDLLIEKAQPQQLDELEKMVDCRSKNNDVREMQKKDYGFHRKLISLGNNEALCSFTKMLEIFFSRQPQVNGCNQQRAVDEHVLIVRALREKNRDFARGLLRSHLSKYLTNVSDKKLNKVMKTK